MTDGWTIWGTVGAWAAVAMSAAGVIIGERRRKSERTPYFKAIAHARPDQPDVWKLSPKIVRFTKLEDWEVEDIRVLDHKTFGLFALRSDEEWRRPQPAARIAMDWPVPAVGSYPTWQRAQAYLVRLRPTRKRRARFVITLRQVDGRRHRQPMVAKLPRHPPL